MHAPTHQQGERKAKGGWGWGRGRLSITPPSLLPASPQQAAHEVGASRDVAPLVTAAHLRSNKGGGGGRGAP